MKVKVSRKIIAILFILDIVLAGMYGVKNGDIFIKSVAGDSIINNDMSDDLDENEETEDKIVALTFDDGPHSKYTIKLLDGLKERNVKASFFVIGCSIKGKEEIIERMAEEGHLIGNHTYSHVRLTSKNKAEAFMEIEDTNNVIEAITGVCPIYVRPPFGEWNKNINYKMDMSIVLWNVDPRDWSIHNAESLAKYIVKTVKSGDIILMHDIYNSSVEAALLVIDRLKAEGYRFVRVDELTENKKISQFSEGSD